MLPLWQATGLQRDPNAQEITVRRQTKALNHTTHFRRVSNTLPAVRVLISNTSDWAYTLARPPCRNTGSIRATAPSGPGTTHPSSACYNLRCCSLPRFDQNTSEVAKGV